MFSRHNGGKPFVAERFIRILKNKFFKHMTSISKNMYIHELEYVVNKYNNTYHSKIKMTPVDVKSSMYVDFDKKNNKENPKFKVGDHVRMSKYKNIFVKGYFPNWSREAFMIAKVENTVPSTYVISDLKAEETIRRFCEKELRNIKSRRV